MTLGQPLAVFIGHQGTVIVRGLRKLQCSLQEDLACGGAKQVGAANNFRDLHLGIIDNHCELIRGHVVSSPHDKITEVMTGDKLLRTEVTVVKCKAVAVRNAKAPVQTDWIARGTCLIAARTRIYRLVIRSVH